VCARHLGTSQASCSFHLRQLAKYGFVELAEVSEDRRERPWRLVDVEQEWSAVDGGPAADQLDRVFIEREAERIADVADGQREHARTVATGGVPRGLTVPVTVTELEQIRDQLMAVVSPYVARLDDPSSRPVDSRFVRLLLSAVPLTHLDDSATDPLRRRRPDV